MNLPGQSRVSLAILAGSLSILASLAGCTFERAPTKKTVNAYLGDSRDLACVRRIMVLPFAIDPGVTADCDRIRNSYVTQLQKLRRFDIVPLPTSSQEVAPLNASLRRGRLATDEIVRLCDRYNLDGVLVGTVTAWRAYQPPHLGLRTHMVSVHSGSIIWSVDAMFDAADRSTISDLRHYHEGMQVEDSTLHGWELTTIAPNMFANYVAWRFVTTWRE